MMAAATHSTGLHEQADDDTQAILGLLRQCAAWASRDLHAQGVLASGDRARVYAAAHEWFNDEITIPEPSLQAPAADYVATYLADHAAAFAAIVDAGGDETALYYSSAWETLQ